MKARFLQGSIYSAGGMIFSTVALLAAGKLLTNTLQSTEVVGQFALLLLCAEFLGMLANLGLPVTLPKLLQAHRDDARAHLLSSLFTLQLLVALALSATAMLAAALGPFWLPLVAAWLPLPLPLLALLPVVLIAVALRDFLLAATAGLHEYGRRAGAIAVMSTLQVTLFAALFFGKNDAPLPFVVSNLFAITAGAGFLARAMPRPQPADWPLAWAQVRFSAPLFANNLLNFLYQRADSLLVIYFLGLGTGGMFEMAKRIPGVLSRFFGAALIPYLPSVSEMLHRDEHARAGQLLQGVSALAAFAGYGITLTVVAVQEPLLHLLFTKEYAGATPVLGPLLIAACLAVQAGIFGQALIALEQPRLVMYINSIMAIASIGLNLFLVPRFGLAGAGWSAAAASFISFALQRRAAGRLGIAIPRGRTLLLHGLFIVAYALLLGLGHTIPVAAAALALFAGGAVASGALPLGELRMLFRRPRP